MKHWHTVDNIGFLVSDEDFIFVAGFSWYFSDGFIRHQNAPHLFDRSLHYLISDRAGYGHPKVVRHIDGDGLNNQRNNLEVTTR